MEKLNALTLALRQNAQGEADLGGLNEDYARAENMRNTSNAKVNQYGTVSPFAVMADVINQSRGRKDMREIAPQRTAARSSVANNANAFKLYQAQQIDQQNKQAQDNFETTNALKLSTAEANAAKDQTALELEAERYATQEGQDQTALNLTAENLESKQENALKLSTAKALKDQAALELTAKNLEDKQNQRATLPVEYYDENGNSMFISTTGAGDFITSDDTKLDSLAGLTRAPEKTETSEAGVSGYERPAIDKPAIKAVEVLGQNKRIMGVARGLSAESQAALNSPNVRMKEFFLNAFSPSDAEALIKEQFSGYPQEAKDFLVSISRLTAIERHELFGATLTQGEKESANDFLSRVEGLTLTQMVNRMKDTHNMSVTTLENMDNLGNGSEYMDTYKRGNYGEFMADPVAADVQAQYDAEDAEMEQLKAEIAAAERL
jgi:hypothetical protein